MTAAGERGPSRVRRAAAVVLRRRRDDFRPFAQRGRWTVPAVVLTFALVSAVSSVLSVRMASGSEHRATVVQVASRQRTLAERYVNEVLLARAGAPADAALTGRILEQSARALLRGGVAPAVNGDDDEAALPPSTDPVVRGQLRQELRLAHDLTATGAALLAGRPVAALPATAHEHIADRSGVTRLRVLAALTSNVSLDAARTIAASADRRASDLVVLQITLGAAGLAASLLLSLVLVAATRRQSAHFRALVTSSTDLVLVFGAGRCRYASSSVLELLGCPESRLLSDGLAGFVHRDDRALVAGIVAGEGASSARFRLRDRGGTWRHLEANVTDLRRHRAVAGIVLNARDITKRVELEQELTRRAYHDELTGLANRALFRAEVAAALEVEAGVAILLADLDGFKQVNDTLGHDAGDDVLRQIARRFGQGAGEHDVLARLAGDEFALLLHDCGEAQAVAAAERLLRSLASAVSVGGREFALGASVGIALAGPQAADSEALLRRADLAMYAAKEAGRNRHVLFGEEIEREAEERHRLEQGLRLAVGRGELELHYQPELDLAGGAVVGAEALLRWRSAEHGDVPPGRFIPIAEQSGAIAALGEFVIAEACRQTAGWERRGLLPEPFTTWVNVSGAQLSRGGLPALVRRALERSGLAGSRLGLEVTETAIVSDGAAGRRALAELHELAAEGVRIAIDDFGTGYSSLAKLRDFPVDLIKVDRSFVAGAMDSSRDAAIVTSVVGLAQALGVRTLAEGIEREEQVAFLTGLGCDLGQGFLFARPAPAAAMAQLLAGALRRPEAA